MCSGKHVVLWYDSDHPKERGGRTIRAGYDAMYRVAKKLTGVAASVRWLRWGEDGWDTTRADGWDVRDEISHAGPVRVDRLAALNALARRIEPVPADWLTGVGSNGSINGYHHHTTTESAQCETWERCNVAWKNALQWRREMADALAVLLAICASTKQGGNQLFLQLVGSAGSGKTTMCDGLLVSSHCHHLEHLTGFHSGWKGDDRDKDCSLIARINGKTLVTPEADVLMCSPRFHEIMGQQRRIFDGKSGATYKNTDKDTLYVGLRTPWIMAGTPAMLDHDQSHLGDRFLRFVIADPPQDEKRSILKSAIRSERTAMVESANGTAGSVVDPKTRLAHALTGGYVDWLRAYVEDRIARVDVPTQAEDQCIDLAELSADLRARPNTDKRKVEVHETKELPTRLARQNVRLAGFLAVALNKRIVDADVMRIVKKVAMDTAIGHSMNIVRWLCSPNSRANYETYQSTTGLSTQVLEGWTGMPPERMMGYLTFLRKIGVIEYKSFSRTLSGWVLTDRVYDLYNRIQGV
jgi:hypothetical protein